MSDKFIQYLNQDDLIDRTALLTEQQNPASKHLDSLSTKSLVNLFSEEDLIPQIAVSKAKNEIVLAIDSIYKRVISGGRLFYLGAGTSGRLGVLDAVECPPTFCTPPELVQGIIAGGISSLVNSSEGLEDEVTLSVSDLTSRGFCKKDCLIGITAGGTTPYVIHALNFGKELNALTIAISCVTTEQSILPCDIDIRLLTGPELLTGSTRLKAGTATKMALNIISTSLMIKLGKVYGNHMIDVSATNSKLVDRAVRILCNTLELEREEAVELLKKSKGSLKLSIIMNLTRFSYEQSVHLLQKFNYNLREAISFFNHGHVDNL